MIRRDCQKEALACIQSTTDVTNLQLCTGAGKSYIIYDASILPTIQTCIIIVPSLLLIQQYYKDMKSHYDGKTLYYFATEGTLKGGIKRLTAGFPELDSSAWIVLTTFASVPLLYNHLVEKKRAIHQIIADEAHHVRGAEYAKSYALAKSYIRHTIHFSATLPEDLTPHYTYPLLKGIRDKVVRDFHIEVVMCKEGDLTSLQDIIKKSIERLDGVHAKILAYTAQANTDNSSVKTFLKEYTPVMETNDWWMDGINDETTSKSKCMEMFEASTKKASLLVSCKTLSEGIDLKHANAMLPWDPTNSIVDNIQRIGRVLRLYKTSTGSVAKEQPPSLILVPVFVKEDDVKECKGDRTKIHELLEKQIGMGARGNFQPIINICTALKSELAEEDSELFNQLLHFPNSCPSVPFDNDLISCIAKKLKKSTETVLEEIADVLMEKDELEEETIEQIREEGVWEEEDAGEVMTALTQSQNLTLTLQEKDTIETFGTGAVPLTLIHDGETYKVTRAKAKDSGKKQVNQRLSVSHTDGFRILLGLDPDDVAEGLSTDEMILTRLTTEVQLDEDWETRRLEWVAMYEKLGKSPSHGSKDPEIKKMGSWQQTQRKGYHKKSVWMTAERITSLEATEGWIWEEKDTWEPSRLHWLSQYQKLGRRPSYTSEDKEEKKAVLWQGTQRQNYKKKKAYMTAERIASLEATEGWKWEEEDTWEPARLHWLSQYQKLGKNPSEESTDPDEKRAGQWQSHQRMNKKKNATCMTPQRIAILEATPGWKWEEEDSWEPNRLHWISQYQKLGKYPSHGSKDLEEKQAGKWQQRQRDSYKKKEARMTSERIAALNATPGWKWSADAPTLTIEPAEPIHTLSLTLTIEPAEPAAHTPKKRVRTVPTATPSTGSSVQRVKSQLEIFHQRFKTMNADTYTKTIAETPTDFTAYHAVASQYDARDPPERQPINKIAAKLAKNNKPSYKAIDLGCGMNTLRQHIDVKNMTWTSIDVHGIDEMVLVADMGNLPFDEESFDIAVLSRSLWAKNHTDVLRETYRILKDGGRAIVCESFRRWIDSTTHVNTLLHALTSVGFTITFEEGTTCEDASDEVFQYIIVQKNV